MQDLARALERGEDASAESTVGNDKVVEANARDEHVQHSANFLRGKHGLLNAVDPAAPVGLDARRKSGSLREAHAKEPAARTAHVGGVAGLVADCVKGPLHKQLEDAEILHVHGSVAEEPKVACVVAVAPSCACRRRVRKRR